MVVVVVEGDVEDVKGAATDLQGGVCERCRRVEPVRRAGLGQGDGGGSGHLHAEDLSAEGVSHHDVVAREKQSNVAVDRRVPISGGGDYERKKVRKEGKEGEK